VNSRREHHWC